MPRNHHSKSGPLKIRPIPVVLPTRDMEEARLAQKHVSLVGQLDALDAYYNAHPRSNQATNRRLKLVQDIAQTLDQLLQIRGAVKETIHRTP